MFIVATLLTAVSLVYWLPVRHPWNLPAHPDFTGYPAEMIEHVNTATSRALGNKESIDGIADLGKLYQANGFSSEAEACWRILLKIDPKQGRWPYYMADLRRTAADQNGVADWLRKTVHVSPQYSPAWLELAELELKTHQLDQAENDYKERLRLTPDDPYARLGLARIALLRGQKDSSQQQIIELVSAAPNFSPAHNLYSEILAQQGDDKSAALQRSLGSKAGRLRVARDPWREELREWCFDPVQLMAWGEMDSQTSQGDFGVTLFKRAAQLAPKNPQVYESLGTAYIRSGNAAQAAEVLEFGSHLPAASEHLYVYLCHAYYTLDKPADRLRSAQRGLVAVPRSSVLYDELGLAQVALGQIEAALDSYHEAIKLAPSSSEPRSNLAMALLHLDRRSEARESLNQALALEPGMGEALTLLADMDIDDGRDEVAASTLKPYFQAHPESPVARRLIVKLYLGEAMSAVKDGDTAKVERVCREGLTQFPDSSELNGFLGAYYVQQGQLAAAVSPLEKAHRLQPNDPRISLSLGTLYDGLGRHQEARELFSKGREQAEKIGEPQLAEQCAAMLNAANARN